MSFAQILGTIQGFFSRGFWFGSFLPVALAGTLHLFLANRIFPQSSPWELLSASGSQAAKFPVIFAGAIVVAYAMTPLVPWIRGMLDGSLLPGWLHDALRREHAAAARNTRDEIGEAYLRYGQFQTLREKWAMSFREARSVGAALAGAKNGSVEEIDTAEAEMKKVRKLLASGTAADYKLTTGACESLDKALRSDSAEGNERLDQCHRGLLKLLADVEVDSRHRADSFAERSGPEVALQQPQATRMADARRYTERYSEDNYGVQFDYLWPRLQLQLPETGATFDRVVSTRAQSDFALLSLALVLTVAAVWLPLLAWYDTSPWFLCGLGIATPLATAFFYQLALQCELAQAELMRSLVDRYRFDVIKNVLRLPLPATLLSERELWRNVGRAQTRGLEIDMTYRHPTA